MILVGKYLPLAHHLRQNFLRWWFLQGAGLRGLSLLQEGLLALQSLPLL